MGIKGKGREGGCGHFGLRMGGEGAMIERVGLREGHAMGWFWPRGLEDGKDMMILYEEILILRNRRRGVEKKREMERFMDHEPRFIAWEMGLMEGDRCGDGAW